MKRLNLCLHTNKQGEVRIIGKDLIGEVKKKCVSGTDVEWNVSIAKRTLRDSHSVLIWAQTSKGASGKKTLCCSDGTVISVASIYDAFDEC